MHCTRCAYPLWNMASRTCPECGTPFKPSEFTFLANAVKFQCPHCRQQYFGTSQTGHLEPAAFTCVTCNTPVTEDEMVIVPADGVREDLAKAADMPWTRRDTGMLGAFAKTCVASLFRPGRLAKGLGPNADVGAAWAFLWRVAVITGLIGGAGMAVMMSLFALMQSTAVGAGPSAPKLGMPTLTAVGIGLSAYPAVILLGTLLWCVAAHGLLVAQGIGRGRFGRTFECFAFASVPLATASLVSPVLCCVWFALFLPPIWMAGAAAAMICERHSANVWKVMLACFGPLAGLGVLTAGAFAALIAWG